MAGRHKPTALKIATGTFQKRRGAGVSVPAGLPEKPDWLSQKASEIWDRLAPITMKCDLLSQNDEMPFALMVDAMSLFLECRKHFPTVDSASIESGEGGKYQDPLWSIMCKQRDFVMRVAREFGMTPSARSGINVSSAGAEDDPLDQLNAAFSSQFA